MKKFTSKKLGDVLRRFESPLTDPDGEPLIEVTTHRLAGNGLAAEGTPRRIFFTGNDTVQRNEFERGRTSAAFARETISSDTFVLGARAGQTLLLNVALSRGNVAMFVLDVAENQLSEEQATSFRGRLQQTGDHTIIV